MVKADKAQACCCITASLIHMKDNNHIGVHSYSELFLPDSRQTVLLTAAIRPVRPTPFTHQPNDKLGLTKRNIS